MVNVVLPTPESLYGGVPFKLSISRGTAATPLPSNLLCGFPYPCISRLIAEIFFQDPGIMLILGLTLYLYEPAVPELEVAKEKEKIYN